MLLALIRSELFMKGEVSLDESRLSYRTLFKETLSDFSLNTGLRHLEKIGVLFCERPAYRSDIDRIKVPSYVYDILTELEEKLPHVGIAETTET